MLISQYTPVFTTDTTDHRSVIFDFDSVGVYGEKYDNADTVVSERPGQTARLFLRGSGRFWGVETLADIFVSSEFTNDRQDMNRISVDGRYQWLQFSLGDHYPYYGNFSISGIRTRGIGVAVSPGHFRLQMNVGQSQTAIEGDSALFRYGMYRRWLYAGRVGWENEEKFYTHINIIKAKDDQHSISRPFGATPQENLMGGWDFGFQLFQKLFFKSEIVFSAHTRDLESTELQIDEFPGFLKGLFRPFTSSSFEYSFKEEMRLLFDTWSLAGFFSRVNSGYSSLGTGFLLSDWQEYRLDSKFSFQNRKINLGFYFGQRNNNLADDRALTTRQSTAGTTFLIRPNQSLYVNSSYSILFETNDATVDSMRRDNIAHTILVQPAIDIFGDVAIHHFDIIASVQSLKDRNPQSVQVFDFTTLNLGTNYMLSLPSPLTVIAGYNVILSKTSLEASTRHLTSGRVMWEMFRSRLSNSLSTTYTRAFSDMLYILDNTRWDFVLNTTYRLTAGENINLDLRQTFYTDKVGKDFKEFIGFLRYTRGL